MKKLQNLCRVEGMDKRLADWLEKVSVASFAVGLFQDHIWGLIVSAVAFAWSMWLTKRMEGKK